MANMRTLAFQVPEDLFQRIKEYLQRNHISQRQFVIGLIEQELDREQTLRESLDEDQEEGEELDEEMEQKEETSEEDIAATEEEANEPVSTEENEEVEEESFGLSMGM